MSIDCQRVSIMIKLQACPVCKKEIKQLHSHLRNKHRLSAKERRPYMKIARESAVKHKNTVLTEINILTEFEEQKCSLDNDFKDIEDLIVTSYLKTKPSLPSTISIRETIRSHLFPLYRMIRDSLDKTMYESMVRQDGDAAPPEVKRVKTEEVSLLDGGRDTRVNETSVKE